MSEPATTAAGAAAVWKMGLLSKLAILLSVGTLAGLLMAAVDPAEAEPDPRKRRRLIFGQVIAAAIFAPMFTPMCVKWLVSHFPILTITDFESWSTVALPVGLVIGALSWGVLGAFVKARSIIRERAAQAVADKVLPPPNQ